MISLVDMFDQLSADSSPQLCNGWGKLWSHITNLHDCGLFKICCRPINHQLCTTGGYVIQAPTRICTTLHHYKTLTYVTGEGWESNMPQWCCQETTPSGHTPDYGQWHSYIWPTEVRIHLYPMLQKSRHSSNIARSSEHFTCWHWNSFWYRKLL